MGKKSQITNRQYTTLEILEEIGKPIFADDLLIKFKEKEKRCSPKDFKDILIALLRHKVVMVEIVKKRERYWIIEAGKQALIQRPITHDTLSNNKEGEKKSTLPIKTDNKTGEIKNSKQVEGNWLEWTTPIWVEENGQWEFYKKQEGQILEIYHSQDEEEIKTKHKSKVMEHIMAAMESPKTEEEEKRKRHPIKSKLKKETLNSLDNPTTGRRSQKIGDSSTFLHLDARFRLMELKLQGHSQQEIILTVIKEYNLKSITVGLYLSDVIKEIRERSKGIVEETLRTHLDRYEVMFKWFRENGYARMALKALERKERLVGLHDSEKVDKAVLSSLDQIGGGIDRRKYDWSRLTEEEYKRMMLLVKRTIIILKQKEENREE